MSEANNSMADRQYLAKILYTREQLDGKVVAKRVGVSEKTISKWVTDFEWKKLRSRLLISKSEILNSLYEQMDELTTGIKNKPAGKRYADSKEADMLIKLTASVRNLETELAIADLVESGIRFMKFLQRTGTYDQVLEVSEFWNSFIQNAVKDER